MKVIAKWLFILGVSSCFFASKQDSSAQIPWHPLQVEKDLDILVKEIGEARIVLLGESTHGAHEFYEWRSALTKKLIEEKGFDFIAIEGDWVDSYKVNQFIKGQQQDSSSVIELLKQYDRWPSSMWGNYEMAELVQWLNSHDQTMISKNKTGFYGLDVYSFWEWTSQDISVQQPGFQNAIKQVRESFADYNNDALKYATAVRKTNANHSASTQNLWSIVQKDIEQQPKDEDQFVLQQQALLALNGERYFRTMATDFVRSWNIRENYMAETIKRLLGFYGAHSKAIIWMHNSHAGDAIAEKQLRRRHDCPDVQPYPNFSAQNVQIFPAYAGRFVVRRIGPGAHRWNTTLESLGVMAWMKLDRRCPI